MVMPESEPDPPSRRRVAPFLYAVVFIAITCATSVTLSIGGYLSLSPLTALVAGLIAGVAFVMFQMTYLKFVVNSSRRMQQRDPDIV